VTLSHVLSPVPDRSVRSSPSLEARARAASRRLPRWFAG
jgi:hypothetical protein